MPVRTEELSVGDPLSNFSIHLDAYPSIYQTINDMIPEDRDAANRLSTTTGILY